jgi:hypothetical protein
MSPQSPPPPPNDCFQAAVAQWRLELRTEIKKASSLPSSMFDACDPMLETRLAETAEAMLKELQDPRALPQPAKGIALRTEIIRSDELQRLPSRFAGCDAVPLDLDQGLRDEYLGVLTDLCTNGASRVTGRAAALLHAELDIEIGSGSSSGVDLEALTRQLWQRVATITGSGERSGESNDELLAICRRLAAAIAQPKIGGGLP